jgi:hypothetical protein
MLRNRHSTHSLPASHRLGALEELVAQGTQLHKCQAEEILRLKQNLTEACDARRDERLMLDARHARVDGALVEQGSVIQSLTETKNRLNIMVVAHEHLWAAARHQVWVGWLARHNLRSWRGC